MPCLLISGLLIAATPVAAANYLVVHSDSTGALLVDRNSIRHNGDSGEAFALYRYDRPIPATGDVPAHRAQRMRFLFDCKSGKLVMAERHYLSAENAGKTVRTEIIPAPRFAAPARQSERMLLASVCAR